MFSGISLLSRGPLACSVNPALGSHMSTDIAHGRSVSKYMLGLGQRHPSVVDLYMVTVLFVVPTNLGRRNSCSG